jgi:putative toxin-antitoxin system antitoxin component (TIGR02293 family)
MLVFRSSDQCGWSSALGKFREGAAVTMDGSNELVPLEWTTFERAFHAGNAAIESIETPTFFGQAFNIDLGDGNILGYTFENNRLSRFSFAVSEIFKDSFNEFQSAVFRLEALNKTLHFEESISWVIVPSELGQKPRLHPAMFMVAATFDLTKSRQFHRSRFFKQVKAVAVESAKADRLIHVVERVKDVFETTDAARDWLSAPNISLSGETPMRLLDTDVGAKNVMDILGILGHRVGG